MSNNEDNNNNNNGLNPQDSQDTNNDSDLEREIEEQIENEIHEQENLNQEQPVGDNLVLDPNRNNEEIIDENNDDDDDNGDDDDDMDDEGEEDDDDDDEELDDYDIILEGLGQVNEDNDDYETVERPNQINFNTELPGTHEYLGENFEEINTPKVVHEENDNITIPILSLNSAQLLPGQIMPLFIYAPLQVNMIKNRIENSNGDPTIGIILKHSELDTLKGVIGIIAEILSCKNEDQTDNNLLVGITIKVKGRERFEIVNLRRDITGCAIAEVKLLSEYVLTNYKNPLKEYAPKYARGLIDEYFQKTKSDPFNIANRVTLGRIERFNFTAHPSWLYRQYDCNYVMKLILNELYESYEENQLPQKEKIPNDAKLFSDWLLLNFAFDDQLRANVLKLDCINQRLRYIYSVLKNFSSVNCRICRAQICKKSDVFSMCVQGFMSAYINPSGQVHETLTVYKAKNLQLYGRPSTEFSWFPGYAWTICQCKNCNSHIGWKFTATKSDMIPDKFWGLTRRAVCHTNDSLDQSTRNNSVTSIDRSVSIESQQQQQEQQNWVPII